MAAQAHAQRDRPAVKTEAIEEAILAERVATVSFWVARARLGEVVDRAVAGGCSFDALARISLRARTGRAGTIRERKRESARLRQVLHRHTVTGRHTELGHATPAAPSASPYSSTKEELNMSTLIRRRIVEEEYGTDNGTEMDGPEDLGEPGKDVTPEPQKETRREPVREANARDKGDDACPGHKE